jgi:YHS domain-containing protein
MEGPVPERAVQAAPKKAGQEGLVDPVCGMTVVAGENPPSVTLHGRTFYFCSEACRAQFVKNQEKFARPERRETPHGGP